MRRGLGAVKLADLAVAIAQVGSRSGAGLGCPGCDLSGIVISLLPRRGRIDREPDDAISGGSFLKSRDVAALVIMLHDEWALRIDPLEDDRLAFEFRERVRRAFDIGKRELGCGLTNNSSGMEPNSENECSNGGKTGTE